MWSVRLEEGLPISLTVYATHYDSIHHLCDVIHTTITLNNNTQSYYLDSHHCATAFMIHFVHSAIVAMANFTLVYQVIGCEVIHLQLHAKILTKYSKSQDQWLIGMNRR